MKQPKSEPVYICSICGKDIAGDHVYIKTRRRMEQHIHYGCMPGRKGNELVERLAAYEDTGLTPKEIERLKERRRWIPLPEPYQ